MRVLVLGRYPPSPDGRARQTVDVVRDLARAGHEVEVLAPDPSAAHHIVRLDGGRGAWALGRRARSFDKLVVTDERLLDGLGSRARALTMRRWREVELLSLPAPSVHDRSTDDAPEPTVDPEPWPDDPAPPLHDVLAAVQARAAIDRASAPQPGPPPPPPIRAMVTHVAKQIVRRSLGRYGDRVIFPVNRVRAKVSGARQRARRGGARRGR